MCFATEQVSHSILSGARSVVNSVRSAPSTCLGSCSIASGPAWPRILCHFVAVAPIGLQAIQLIWCLFEVENVDWVDSREFVGSLCISAQWPPSHFA